MPYQQGQSQEGSPRDPNLLDAAIGQKIRNLRNLRHITQLELSRALGITSQQLQKYESGANRISASRLFEVANLLSISILYFYERKQYKSISRNSLNDVETFPRAEVYQYKFSGWDDMLSSRETIRLLSLYHAITDASGRKRVLDLAAVLGNVEEPT